MVKYLVFLFVTLITVNLNTGYFTGAPAEICETMTPNHFNAEPQLNPAPYTLLISATNVSSQGRLKVTIEGTEIFRGFLIQARDTQNNIFGTFEPHPMANVMDCPPGKDNAITHRNNTEIFSAVFTWRPEGSIGKGYFTGTIVKNKAIFWTHLKSPNFEVL